MKRFFLLIISLTMAYSSFAQTKMFINKTSGADSMWLSDIKSITFKTYSSVPTLGLIAYYPFNGNADDASGNGLNGHVVGAQLTTGRRGDANSAYKFNGSTDSITIGNQAILQVEDFTATAWMKYTGPYPSTAASRTILMKSSKDVDGFNLGVVDSGVIFEASKSGSHTDPHIGIFQYDSTKWHFVAYLYNKATTTVKGYVDGVPVSTQVFAMSKATSVPLKIGHGYDTIGYYGTKGWIGSLEDIRLYNRALSDAEIQALFNEK